VRQPCDAAAAIIAASAAAARNALRPLRRLQPSAQRPPHVLPLMKSSASKLRARAASPSSPAAPAAAAKGVDDDRQQQHLASPQASHLGASSVFCDAFWGFPFGAGVWIGQVMGLPLRLLGFLLYATMVIPRITLWALKALLARLFRVILYCALVAVLLAAAKLYFTPGTLAILEVAALPFVDSLGNIAAAALLLLAASYFFPQVGRLVNMFLLAALAKWLLPTVFAYGGSVGFSVADAALASSRTVVAVVASQAAAIAAVIVCVVVLYYMVRAVATLLNLCLWVLLLLPRFFLGVTWGLSGSLDYGACALMLEFHPNHSW